MSLACIELIRNFDMFDWHFIINRLKALPGLRMIFSGFNEKNKKVSFASQTELAKRKSVRFLRNFDSPQFFYRITSLIKIPVILCSFGFSLCTILSFSIDKNRRCHKLKPKNPTRNDSWWHLRVFEQRRNLWKTITSPVRSKRKLTRKFGSLVSFACHVLGFEFAVTCRV